MENGKSAPIIPLDNSFFPQFTPLPASCSLPLCCPCPSYPPGWNDFQLLPRASPSLSLHAPAFPKTSNRSLYLVIPIILRQATSPFSKEKKKKKDIFNPLDYPAPSTTSPVLVFLPYQGFQFFSSNCTKVLTLGPV